MTEKRRYTVSLPDHVADAVEAHAKSLGSTPTEYAGDIVRWWFGQGCPPVTHDEAELRKSRAGKVLKERVKPLPIDLSVWALNPDDTFVIMDDSVVQKLLSQLGIPNLFAHAAEHEKVRLSIAFDNHPTHWLVLDLYKGSDRPEGDGLMFRAYPKTSMQRAEMLRRLQAEVKDMGAKGPVVFSQIPMLEAKNPSNQTATKTNT